MTTLNCPPFPAGMELDADTGCWRAMVELRPFKPTPVGMRGDKREPPLLELLVGIDRRAIKAGQLNPTAAQVKAYQYLLENEQHVFDCCLDAITTNGVLNLREMLAPSVEPDLLDILLPNPMSGEQFKERARFVTVDIHLRERDDVAYIEYYYCYDWDKAMSQKVALHKDRIVYVGGGGDGWRDR